MITEQAKQMAGVFSRPSQNGHRSRTWIWQRIRDITEGLHVCGTEPEGHLR